MSAIATRLISSAIGLVLVLVVLVLAVSADAAAIQGIDHGDEVVLYVAPTSALVVDPFRPPSHVGGTGNRGLEYGTSAGMPISAAADGYVGFVGLVAGRMVITVEHGDGVRTTYTGAFETWLLLGESVERDYVIGIADGSFHLGARLEDHYLDPQILIDASVLTAGPPRLVPEGPSS